jgi:hypothetical protein
LPARAPPVSPVTPMTRRGDLVTIVLAAGLVAADE